MLTSEQKTALQSEAVRRGLDPDALIKEAERLATEDEPKGDNKSNAPQGEQPKLFMYLLPFVRVREVRQVWLGLTESFPGDDEVASAWAAKQAGGSLAPAAAGEPE
jgi:hypothetical protein